MGQRQKHYVEWAFCTVYFNRGVLVTQYYPTLCDPMDCSLPGSSVHGVLQTREQPFPSPGDLPDPGIEPRSPAWQAESLLSESMAQCIL